jgi:hypothetical protein
VLELKRLHSSVGIGRDTTPQTIYQTALLTAYRDDLRERATQLFQLVEQRIGSERVRKYEGSFSVLKIPSLATAAKIVIFENGKGYVFNPPDPPLVDGVYVWVRVADNAPGLTIGVAPHYEGRYAYLRVARDMNLQEMADFLAACAGAEM